MIQALYSIFVFIVLGYFAKQVRLFGNRQGNTLIGFLLNFALPAIIFYGVYHAELSFSLVGIFLLALFSSILVSTIAFILIYKVFNRPIELALTIGFLCILHNTLFLGVPIINGSLGEEASHKAILFDQFCTSIPLAVIAPLLISFAKKTSFKFSSISFQLIKNPLFVAMVAGFALRLVPLEIPDYLFAPIKALGACATPVALFAIGVQLSFSHVKKEWKYSLLALFFAMLVVPATYFSLMGSVGPIFDLKMDKDFQMALIETSMPPLISSAAIIAKAGLNQKVAVSAIVIGICLSGVIAPMWLFVSNL